MRRKRKITNFDDSLNPYVKKAQEEVATTSEAKWVLKNSKFGVVTAQFGSEGAAPIFQTIISLTWKSRSFSASPEKNVRNWSTAGWDITSIRHLDEGSVCISSRR